MTEPPTKPPQPIADDIPVTVANKVGRRIYVHCGYQSTLGTWLREELRATWDRDRKLLWVGTGKLDQVLPPIREHIARIARIEAVKTAGHYVAIPYDAEKIRAAAKDPLVGGVYDSDRKIWAFPTAEAAATIRDQVAGWQRALDERRAAVRAENARIAAEAAAEDRDARAAMAAAAEDRIIARSGRDVTDDRGTASGQLTGRMRRPEAEQRKPQPGTVRRLRDGRRVLVLACDVEFWSQDQIDDGLVSGGTDSDPGWYWSYRYVVVVPTPAEEAADAAEAAEAADHATLAALIRDAELAADRSEVVGERSAPIPPGARITEYGATNLTTPYGSVTLTDDGGCWWHHPGWYDDYRVVTGPIRDEQVIGRVRAAVAAGARIVGRYKVTVPTEPAPQHGPSTPSDGSSDPDGDQSNPGGTS